MSKIARFAVLVASLMSLFAMMSATAGAVTWHNRGDTAFTATNPATGTLSVTGVNLVCHGATATGASPSAAFGGTLYTGATGTVTFSPCFISGIPTHVGCTYSLTVSAAATGTTPPTFDGNADVTCDVTQFNTKICHIEGQTAASYTNPEGAFGKLVLSHSNTLTVTSPAGASCPLGSPEQATLTTQTFTITNATGGPTPHTGPTIVRTA
jgi:hypothetical protein